jgi:hypothetical protein
MALAEHPAGTIRSSVIETRAALVRLLRDATLEAITEKLQEVEGGAWDGVSVVTRKDVDEVLATVFGQEIPPPSERTAEVVTPGYVIVSAICPKCDIPQTIAVSLSPQLIVDDDGAELKVKASTKGASHVCGQLPLPATEQMTLDEALTIEDLRLGILRAVADVNAAWSVETDDGPPPTLDAIAARLGTEGESDRADLEDTLYGYAGGEAPLVELVSAKGRPPHYILTEAGIALIAAAEQEQATDDAAGDEDDDA